LLPLVQTKTKRAPQQFIPFCTSEQKAYLLQALEKMQREFADDLKLVDILSFYREDIENNIQVSEPAVNAKV